MEKTGDFYDLLGVQKQASQDEIRSKYHELAKMFHPDRVQDKDKEVAHRVFVRINQAYSTLIDPDKRERYDQRHSGKIVSPAPQGPPASPEEIREWMSAATVAFQSGDLETSHGYLRRVIKAGKAPIEAYILIGDIYVGEKHKEKALTAYQFALKMQPDNKMLQTKVLRLEEVLGVPLWKRAVPRQSEGSPTAEKRGLFSRLSDMRAKKP
jgi:curved DNA-binding protein CbpA